MIQTLLSQITLESRSVHPEAAKCIKGMRYRFMLPSPVFCRRCCTLSSSNMLLQPSAINPTKSCPSCGLCFQACSRSTFLRLSYSRLFSSAVTHTFPSPFEKTLAPMCNSRRLISYLPLPPNSMPQKSNSSLPEKGTRPSSQNSIYAIHCVPSTLTLEQPLQSPTIPLSVISSPFPSSLFSSGVVLRVLSLVNSATFPHLRQRCFHVFLAKSRFISCFCQASLYAFSLGGVLLYPIVSRGMLIPSLISSKIFFLHVLLSRECPPSLSCFLWQNYALNLFFF